MSWCTENLSLSVRESIARSCFNVRESHGYELKGTCPGHKDVGYSFGYNLAKDVCCCFAECGLEGDLITLWGFTKGYIKRADAENAFFAIYGDGSISIRDEDVSETAYADEPKYISEIEWRALPRLHEIQREFLSGKYAWSDETMISLDLRVSHSIDGSRICIPIRDQEERLINIRQLLPEGSGEPVLSWSAKYHSNVLFPDPSRWNKLNPLVICRNEKDCITMLSMGGNACATTDLAAGWDRVRFNHYFNGREVIIGYGNDLFDKNLSRKLSDSLCGVARRVRIIQWPNHIGGEYGAAEWFADYNKNTDDFKKLLISAKCS